MASWLREPAATIAKASLASTPVRSYDLLVVFPFEVWEIIIPNVPEEALGRLAASARFFRKLIDDEQHWRRRLALHGLLELFEAHLSRKAFPTWKEYFVAHYLASRKPFYPPPLPFVPEHMASIDSAPRALFDNELLDQFSSVAPGDIKEIIIMVASKPYYPRFTGLNWEQSRGAHPGQEHGVFLMKTGELKVFYASRGAKRDDVIIENISFRDTVATFRQLKSGYLFHSVPCPFSFSYLDWHFHLLDCIRVADPKYAEHWQCRNTEEHYFDVISRRKQPPRITVHYQLESAKFEVRHRSTSPLLTEIIQRFKVSKEYHAVTHKQLHLQNYLGVVFPYRTSDLVDGQVWLLRPDKASKRNSFGLQIP